MKPQTLSYYQQTVQHAIERIARGLDDALDLESIATGVCLSPFHFHRIFRGMTGETPLELTRRLRLERAAWQLVESDRPVIEIAFGAGYEAHEAFTRAFRAAYATSPSGFRQHAIRRFVIAAASGVHFDPDGDVAAFVPRNSGGQNMNVTIENMPELRVGAVRHVGPYMQINRAFAKLGDVWHRFLGEWLPASAERLRNGPSYEIYRNTPEHTKPSQLRTDLYIPLE
ncbi:MAG TPA: AraC family transcriptional regulator [Gemmatimonadaceae bacterium]|nr:AraC family transcriptional regulator [Gemmatimonadaceae bacterium]